MTTTIRTLAPPAFVTVLSLCAAGQAAYALPAGGPSDALKKLSIEELMNLEVTSVSRTAESLGAASAAVSVVTNADIRRSGATTVAEALRGIPGIHVGRRNSNSWAVSSRGFSSINSQKLLVLADTRSIYTPLFSGVFWDVQDYLMEDLERIEVIRGPGASLWGSNAVNGVVSITTRSAKDTQGLFASAAAGTQERGSGALRYGGRIGETGHYRVFGQFADRGSTFKPGAVTSDDWRIGHIGFRADWEVGDADALTLQSDLYRANIGQFGPAVIIVGRQGAQGDLQVRASGGNVLGRWRHRLAGSSDLQLRVYYDRTHRNDPVFHDDLDTFDFDLQHHVSDGRQDLIWGVSYRYTYNRNRGKVIFALDPQSSRDQLVSGFVQDQIALLDDLRLTLGTKLEHNDFSGFELQLTVRLLWDVTPAHNVWAAISRAVRVPTRLERDVAIDILPPGSNPTARLLGRDDFDAEELLAYEVGHRWQALDWLSLDAAAFHNRYEGLASLEVGAPFVDAGGTVVIPVSNFNLTDARTQGLELQMTFSPRENWRLSTSYAYIDLDLQPRGTDRNRGVFFEDATPRHQLSVRSSLELPDGWQVDAQFRHLTRIERLPESVTAPMIDAYSELDLRLAWQVDERVQLALVGQNLLHDHHVEFGSVAARGEIERGVYGKVRWHF